MFTCRSAPVTADEFPDDVSDLETAWPRLQEDDPVLHVLWGASVSVGINERSSDSTGQFEWPSMPPPYIVQSQTKFGEGCICVLRGFIIIFNGKSVQELFTSGHRTLARRKRRPTARGFS